jgi:DNA invertase Pin-like site-specific DNA recombinase
MIESQAQKVTTAHLTRKAYLYVRQSTLRQVLENQESTKRQYALKERAVALGWAIESIVVIDQDQGESGASTDREGFARLVAEVGQGHAGIVLGLEVSRLARNSTDWHRLLEICALAGTLILDEDGIYDPAHFNDRLLLGLKGTMSEAELHVLRARLRGGILSKARRGELPMRLPVGLVQDELGRIMLDPDQQVQEALRAFFATFRRTGSATATVRDFREQKLRFPHRLTHRGGGSDLLWGELTHSRALELLHNPRYAGAFAFGRRRTRRGPGGKVLQQDLPREAWTALIPGAHPGYITWQDFEENLRLLRQNQAVRGGGDRRRGPPREGPALLQGLVICGRCGDRMTVRYDQRLGRRYPSYVCQRRGIEHASPTCQIVPGSGVDRAVGALLVKAVAPEALEMALAVQTEVAAQVEEADGLRRRQVERARYEADAARRRFLRVDPDNRLVADALEADWNQRLRDLAAAQEEYERQRVADKRVLGPDEQQGVRALAADFPRIWEDPATPERERKRMVRLLVEDVTLRRANGIEFHVRLRGGTCESLTIPLPLSAWQMRKTPPELVAEVDALLEDHSDEEIAHLLDERGRRSGAGRPVTAFSIYRLRRAYHLRSRAERLQGTGLLTRRELAARLTVSPRTISAWRRRGLLKGRLANAKGEWLFELPSPDFQPPRNGRPPGRTNAPWKLRTDPTREQQYEA